MLQLTPPTDSQIRRLLADQRARPFSYRAVGATRTRPPPWHTVDHNRVRLGRGRAVWERAVAAVRRWEMFHLGWVRLYWPDTPIAAGSTVAVVSRQWGFWSVNAARIVYTICDDGPVARFGFAYGTLPHHVERGEERFCVEWRHADDSVWYDILAFSRPHHSLLIPGYPVARIVQRRFARDSKRAMLRAVHAQEESARGRGAT
ncbi:MAG TPA: DUF1990 domain-containing protein [Chloroflexia bacterium]|nr:DUF1990 domain-containing protein [Chloroflexia bacterium]